MSDEVNWLDRQVEANYLSSFLASPSMQIYMAKCLNEGYGTCW